MLTEVLSRLEQGRAIIAKPENWIQRNYAQNEYGVEVAVGDPRACRFCSVGALMRVSKEPRIFDEAVDRLCIAMNDSVANFNDHRTHAEVLAAWDNAIASVKELQELP